MKMKITGIRHNMAAKSVFSIVLLLTLSSFAVEDVFANNLAATNYAVSGTVALLSLSVNPNLPVDANAESLALGTITTWKNNGTSAAVSASTAQARQ